MPARELIKNYIGIQFYAGKLSDSRIQFGKSEGCLTVEMEAAVLFAVAKFRGVELAQILYAGDNLDSDKWEPRGWNKNNLIREKLIWLSAEACLLL